MPPNVYQDCENCLYRRHEPIPNVLVSNSQLIHLSVLGMQHYTEHWMTRSATFIDSSYSKGTQPVSNLDAALRQEWEQGRQSKNKNLHKLLSRAMELATCSHFGAKPFYSCQTVCCPGLQSCMCCEILWSVHCLESPLYSSPPHTKKGDIGGDQSRTRGSAAGEVMVWSPAGRLVPASGLVLVGGAPRNP